MDTDEKANGEAKPPAPKTRKVKKQVRKGDLPLSAGTASLDQATKDAFAEKEGQMISEDKLVADTEDKKNELESEIYAMRNKIEEPYESNGYADFANEQEKDVVKQKCEQLEVSLMSTYIASATCADMTSRTGYMTRARTLPKRSTSPSWTNYAPQPDPSSSASTTSARRKKTPEERLPKKPQPRSVPTRTPRRRPKRRSGKRRRMRRRPPRVSRRVAMRR